MTTGSVATPTTDLQQFGEHAAGVYMFAINSGFPLPESIHLASCLEDSVTKLLGQAVGSTRGMTPETAFLCEFALETAKALRISCGQED